jgi:hypothetical protein
VPQDHPKLDHSTTASGGTAMLKLALNQNVPRARMREAEYGWQLWATIRSRIEQKDE